MTVNSAANVIEVTPAALGRILSGMLVANRNTCVWGKPGIGKSEGIYQAAKNAPTPIPTTDGWRVIEVRAALMDAVDFMGAPTIVDGRTVYGRPYFFPAEDDDTPTIIFLDELNRAQAAVMNAGFQMLDLRRVGQHRLNPNTRVIAACNGEQDGGGVTRMMAALKVRFTHLHVTPSLPEWSTWAAGNGIHPLVIGFLRFRPNLLHDFDPVAEASPNPRSWRFISDLVNAQVFTPEDELAVFAGTVGYAAALEFIAFKDLLKTLPSIDAILLNPSGANVPTDVGQLYAVSSALSSRADAGNIDRVITYLDRCPIEYAAFSVRDAVTRDPGLASTDAFIGWAVDHQDVVG